MAPNNYSSFQIIINALKNLSLKLLVCLCLVMGLNGSGFAQFIPSNNPKAQKLFETGKIQLDSRMFEQAQSYFEKATQTDPDFAFAWLALANVHNTMRRQDERIKCLEKFVSLKPKTSELPPILYQLAGLYIGKGNYLPAQSLMESFLADTTVSPQNFNLGERRLQQITFALNGIKNPVKVKPELMAPEMNALPLEYFPSMTADGEQFFFTGRKGNNDASDDEDLYTCRKINCKWSLPKPLSNLINTESNEGTATFSADGRTMVFAASYQTSARSGCDLYTSQKIGEDWQKPQFLANVNSPNWDSQPSLSADGNALYFASDRPGGHGKYDIWVSRRQPDGQFGAAVNLGPTINTAESEFGPCIHANGSSLLFSSSGHLGFGGQDLFISQLKPKTEAWGFPLNLGYPINTHLSETSIFVTADGKQAFINKEDNGNGTNYTSKLYQFPVPGTWNLIKVCTWVKGTVNEDVTKKPLSASVELVDLKLNKPVYTVQSDSISGQYLMVIPDGGNYGLYVNKKSFLPKSQNLNAEKLGNLKSIVQNFVLVPIKAGENVRLSNLFFETNKFSLLPESINELNRLIAFLTASPTVSIEISGHTDDVGLAADNLKLSNQRALAVQEYLVKNGIDKKRLTAKGYGFTQPVSKGTDEPARQANRRIEFKILGK